MSALDGRGNWDDRVESKVLFSLKLLLEAGLGITLGPQTPNFSPFSLPFLTNFLNAFLYTQ